MQPCECPICRDVGISPCDGDGSDHKVTDDNGVDWHICDDCYCMESKIGLGISSELALYEHEGD